MASSHRFGRFEVRTAQRLLLADGRRIEIGARAYDLLVALIEHRDRVMAKGELLDLVWSGLVVEEHNLATQISTLRKLLGVGVIATVPGRGYRFTAEVAYDVRDDAQKPLLDSARTGGARAHIPTNLPVELPPLYGREDDIEAVCKLIKTQRLVTVVGAGGIGKTRLAEAAVHGLQERHPDSICPDGVWLVDLAPLTDAAMLPDAVAHALGIRLHGHGKPCDELVAALAMMRAMLVLDNCEHVTDAVASLSQALLDHAPGVRLLATSQVPLALPAEHLFRLEPLAVPAKRDEAHALDHGAVRLFVERVRTLDRHFALSTNNLGPVVDICRQLDGLPLAIELAAARVPLFGVQGVHDRLGKRFQVLAAASRNRPKRQRTLRATLDWSYSLLNDDEKRVLRRLGVFSGGCTVEAAQRVASGGEMDESGVLEVLGRLVDKSLVVADRGELSRLRLLESVRAYAIERLHDAGELTSSHQRHSEYFLALFRSFAEALDAGAMTEAQFEEARHVESDNLREAVNQSLRQ